MKEFEKAEAKLASAAATNLSFLYFLVKIFCLNIKFDLLSRLFQEKDLNNAHKYADLALKTDKFNPACM